MVVVWTPKAKEELKEILVYWKKRNKSNTYSVKLNTEAQKVVKWKIIQIPAIKIVGIFFVNISLLIVLYLVPLWRL